MKRLKLFFAIVLLLAALPFWRFLDLMAFLLPFKLVVSFALMSWFGVFVMIPVKLIFPNVKVLILVVSIFLFGTVAYLIGPHSSMATMDSSFRHCSAVTFTGTFYPARKILTDAYRDDLEARNQLCWLRKMISRVPENFSTEDEINSYVFLIQKKLLQPEIKFRVALPLIAFLYGKIYAAYDDPAFSGKRIYDSLHFWINHYTEEIGQRDYSPWNWPHSDYIRWEYGFIERNWEDLINSVELDR